jgi:glycine cleavage system aminomethyltransferase T
MRDATGDGLELWMQAEDGLVVWDRLWRVGSDLGVAAVGADTLETVRIEFAVPRPAVDWQPAQLAREASDLCGPSDLGFAPALARRFNGADALRRARPGRAPVPLVARGTPVGRLTSAAWSEARAGAVAIGWLDTDAAVAGTKITVSGPRAMTAEVVRSVFKPS